MGTELPIVMHISESEGRLIGSMDSPAQMSYGLPFDEVNFNKPNFYVSNTSINFKYEGVLNGKDLIEGKFTQNNFSLELNLYLDSSKVSTDNSSVNPKTKAAKKSAAKKDKSRLFTEEDFSFVNPIDQTVLSGTLTIPKKVKSFPVVILVSGSGPQNRDSELFGHKPFEKIAEYLSNNSVAVLRYDDRGVGASKGDFAKATTEDFVQDCIGGIAALKLKLNKKATKIGVIGHSEGGLVSFIAASIDPQIDFIVSLAGPVVPIKQLMSQQTADILAADDFSEDEIEHFVTTNRKLYDLATMQISNEEKRSLLSTLGAEYITAFADNMKETMRATFLQSAEVIFQDWFVEFLKINPADFITKLNCDILALNGGKDLQVNPVNITRLKELTQQASPQKVQTKVYPNLNHLFQNATTGKVSEYATIEESFANEVLVDILAFVLTRK